MLSKQALETGQLLRYKTTDGSWIGELVAVQNGKLMVKWLGDHRTELVAQSSATAFAHYVTKHPTRKLKTIYYECFGKKLQRIPKRSVKRLHRVFRKHGITFDQTKTRADDYVRLEMNSAYLGTAQRRQFQEKVSIPDAVSHMLPGWIVQEELPASSRDPLGFQAEAAQLADRLLPGLTVFTNRAGYWFFLSWALRECNKPDNLTKSERREQLNALERALVLCETLYHEQKELDTCFHQGQRAKTRLWADAGTSAKIPDRILKNQNNTGCYNLYTTAMQSFGIWEFDEEAEARGYLPFRLTARGERLAQLFEMDASKKLVDWVKSDGGKRDVETIRAWGNRLCFTTLVADKRRKKTFLEGFIFAKGGSESVREADTRRCTIIALDKAGLLFKKMQFDSGNTLLSDAGPGNDLSEAEVPDYGQNIAVLIHFYTHRESPVALPFVPAAVYELLCLGMNALLSALLDEIQLPGRISIAEWAATQASQSRHPQVWHTPLQLVARTVRQNENQLVWELLTEKPKLENGLRLLIRVLTRRENRGLMDQEPIGNAAVRMLANTLLAGSEKTLQDVLPELIMKLVERHREVSDRKGKQIWINTDGREVWIVDWHKMQLGFHSYRFPQLQSLVRDLHLTAKDLTGE